MLGKVFVLAKCVRAVVYETHMLVSTVYQISLLLSFGPSPVSICDDKTNYEGQNYLHF